MAKSFPLKSLFTLTGLAALFSFGIAAAKEDGQTGVIIALFSIGLILAWSLLRVSLAVWAGMAAGFAFGAFQYWWNNTYHEVVPADRLFEFAITTIWCSAAGGALSLAVWLAFRRAGRR